MTTTTEPVQPQTAEVPACGPAATIHQRMLAILTELPPIGKTEYNEQQKFHFRGHDAVLNALNPLLAKHGVFAMPTAMERITEQRTTSRGSVMYEVNLRIRFTFYGACGDSVVGETWGEGTDMGDKATNKAMTMAFKAVLAQAFAVSTAEFSDSDAATPEETTGRGKGKPEPIVAASDDDVLALQMLLAAEGVSAEKVEQGFDAARGQNRGVLSPEWVATMTANARKRAAAKTDADKAAGAPGEAVSGDGTDGNGSDAAEPVGAGTGAESAS